MCVDNIIQMNRLRQKCAEKSPILGKKFPPMLHKAIAVTFSDGSNLTMNSMSASTLLALILTMGLGAVGAEESHHGLSEPLGFNLHEGWFAPTAHSHFSRRGTPMIHSFRVEPAFTRRDFLLDYSFGRRRGEDEHEIEAELEWALTRRLGVVLEVPYTFVHPDGEAAVDGFGALAISPRFLLAEYERFLLAFALEVETPTGSIRHDLGSVEVALAPSFSTWIDLGHWWAANTQCGVEHALESNDSELFCRMSLIHTLMPEAVHDDDETDHDHTHGLTPGLISLILEVDTAMALSGAEDGDIEAEGIAGLYCGISDHMDLRLGYVFPLSTAQDLYSGLTAGFLWHF